MLPSLLLVATPLLAVVAADNSFTLPASFNAGVVSDSQKNAWCSANLDSCPKICPDGVASKNTCNPTALSFNCICSDGSTPKVEEYKNTLPFFVCEENFGQCINAHPNDLSGQKECKAQRAQNCGTKDVPGDDDDDDTSNKNSSNSSGSSSSSGGDDETTTSATSASATSSLVSKTRAASTAATASATATTASGKNAAKASPTSTASATSTEEENAAVATFAPHGGVLGAAALVAINAVLL